MQVTYRNGFEKSDNVMSLGNIRTKYISTLPLVTLLVGMITAFLWICFSYNTQISWLNVKLMEDGNTFTINFTKNFIYTLFVTSGAFITIFFIAGGFFNKIVSRKEIEHATLYPIIGEFPFKDHSTSLVVNNNQKTLINQQFRQLKKSMDYLRGENGNKNIMVTSSMSAEGKSFIAANLALSLAMANKKVALLELDLNNPTLCEKFGISRDIGLTNYLTGDAREIEIINRTNANLNLYVLPAGPKCEDASELLINGKMQTLLDYLDASFDYVILDMPDISTVKDAFVISALCSATLFVIRRNHTPKKLVKKLEDSNRIAALGNIGIVFNSVKEESIKNKESISEKIYVHPAKPKMHIGYLKSTV